MKHSDIINKEIAKELGLTKDLVENISRSQFEFLTSIMESGVPDKPESYRSVRLQYLGVWYVNPWRRDKLIASKLKKLEEIP